MAGERGRDITSGTRSAHYCYVGIVFGRQDAGGRIALEVKVRALLAERRQHIGYEKKIIAEVSACP